MASNTDKENWIDGIMGSLNGLQRPPADPAMHQKVMNRLKKQGPSGYSKIITRVAVAAVLLLVVNIASLLHFSKTSAPATQQSITQVVNEDLSALSESSF